MGNNRQRQTTFHFKQFSVLNDKSAMKVGTDGVLLGAWVDASNADTALDVGTGTGLVALMLAQRYADLRITGLEIDDNAVAEATYNFEHSPWADRFELVNADFNRYTTIRRYDLIVSNPPFFIDALRPSNDQRSLARHTVTLSYRSLIEQADRLLSDNGHLAMILPYECKSEVLFAATMNHMSLIRLTRVATKQGAVPKRILVELAKGNNRQTQIDTLIIGSDKYIALTEDFYL